MKISCFECNESYQPGLGNVKILGVFIETECPFCGYVYEGKFLNFVEKQSGYSDGMLKAGAKMQQIAQYVELNSSEYYNKDKKRKKRAK
jgi:hypothetical protein